MTEVAANSIRPLKTADPLVRSIHGVSYTRGYSYADMLSMVRVFAKDFDCAEVGNEAFTLRFF